MRNLTPACIYCSKRDGCMDYSDEMLFIGLDGGHVPAEGECNIFVQGDESTRAKALHGLDEFNFYAKNLIKSFSEPR